MSSTINRRDLDFLLYEFLGIEELCQRDIWSDHDRTAFDAVLDLAEQIAEDKFLPLAAQLDEHEPEFDGEKVHILPGVKEAHEAFIEAGFMSAHCSYEEGGMQLPLTVTHAARAIFSSANIACLAYLGLTSSAANMLSVWGSDELKKKFLPPMRNGRFYGTMCLSEPHAGSNLADIRTRAEPQEDGTYRIYGTKMWISGGEQDLSENIVHMVLAKIPGSPPGVKGISLFLVPKYRLDEAGNPAERNGVNLVGLNHKMGYRGTTNTLLNFGEKEACVGHLMGTENEGLRCMFHMMNESRIGVGMGAVTLGYAGYMHSLAYAKERPQGRLPGEKDPNSPQVNIIEHADVKRMLLQQKAYVEGGLALTLFCDKLVDDGRTVEADKREDLAIFMDLLTPIVKAWPSDYCLKANELAIQVLGGAGYTRDYPVERLYRDNRLNPIHEGTNGIQGMDLLGRKVRMKDGYAYKLLVSHLGETIERARGQAEVREYAEALEAALGALTKTTERLTSAANEDIKLATANATVYLHAFGHTVVAWLWLKQAMTALSGLADARGDDRAFYQGKLATCRYFYRYELPQVYTWLSLLETLDDTCLNMPVECF
ncbi:acyl-CoA dehydrogenase [Gilvimarinus sp. F26214L]|uniref:acyl-CoA dehydrogenase n=1 Tax=Gilvimarinus sp. DZF01 TaxID=3461371 RepID=UPI004045E51C